MTANMQPTNTSKTQRVKALATTIIEEDGHYLQERLGKTISLKLTAEWLQGVDASELAQIEILLPFIYPHIGRDEMEALPHLKLIATRSTGHDHIDITEASKRGILVANVPGYGETAVAEHTFALILTLSRKIHLASTRTQQGNYSLDGLQGFDLYGKTLGVIGAGAIGLHVIRIAKGFGMQVLAQDVMQNRLFAEVLGFRYVSLQELLAHSDIVSLHTPSSFHLINAQALSQMKRGALLINTARGSLVDTGALLHALDQDILAGVGLDTLEGEEYIQHEEELLRSTGIEEQLKLVTHNRLLQRRSNVVITPHIAFNTQEALRRILDTTVENVQGFLTDSPIHLVQPR
jgi:D-lactate dehydrogenase